MPMWSSSPKKKMQQSKSLNVFVFHVWGGGRERVCVWQLSMLTKMSSQLKDLHDSSISLTFPIWPTIGGRFQGFVKSERANGEDSQRGIAMAVSHSQKVCSLPLNCWGTLVLGYTDGNPSTGFLLGSPSSTMSFSIPKILTNRPCKPPAGSNVCNR